MSALMDNRMSASCGKIHSSPEVIALVLLNELSDNVRWRAAWAKWDQRDMFANAFEEAA